MGAIRILAILLIVGGAVGLAYGGFSYTKETHKADVGPVHLQVNEKEHVNIPVWAGLGSVVLGVILLAVPKR
jgi:hypothetical protein